MKDLIKKQNKEFAIRLIEKTSDGGFQLVGYEKAEENLEKFISKVRKETAEAVLKEITIWKFSNLVFPEEKTKGWNECVDRLEEIKQQILKELL